ncbi:MAG: (Fe-S)-binding protein [Deltaproteobacteria bacterium]|nr:(Fe-S)-binding protein [Deltaproteobacteria bacterium]
MSLKSIIMIVLVLGSFTSFCFFMSRLIRWVLKGQPEKRWDHIPQRLLKVLINVFGQKRLLNEKVAGTMHFFIFWGFIFITVGTIEILISGIFPSFSLEFLPESLFKFLKTGEDILSFAVFCAISCAFFRRLVLKPKRMEDNPLSAKRDALLVLGMILGVVTTNLFMNGFKIAHAAGMNESLHYSMPVANWIAEHLIFNFNIKTSYFITGYEFFWWGHVVLILGFLNYLPFSKHLHIMLALPNVFFHTLEPTGKIQKINLEDEAQENFGVGKVEQFSWKNLLDTYACTECGRCNVYCPTFNTGKDLKPKSLIADLRHHLYHEGKRLLKGEEKPSQNLIEAISENAIWDCTTCGACMEACPVFIEHIPKIIDMRRYLVLMEGKMEPGMQDFFTKMENYSNPWGFSREERGKWKEGLTFQVPVFAALSEEARKNIEYLYFVGCSGSYDERNQKTSRAFARLLNKAEVKFAILAAEEKCTGDPSRRLGNEYLAQTQIQENVETFKKYNIKKILTQCPHCFNTFKNEYPEFGGNYEVVHHTTFLKELLKKEKLKIDKELYEQITFHDSCYLGRHNREFESSREILKSIPGIKLKEMPRNKENGFCCGAGGGRMWVEESRGHKRVNVERLEEALETKSQKVVMGCPYCMTMFEDATKVKDAQNSIKNQDVAEILDSVIS